MLDAAELMMSVISIASIFPLIVLWSRFVVFPVGPLCLCIGLGLSLGFVCYRRLIRKIKTLAD